MILQSLSAVSHYYPLSSYFPPILLITYSDLDIKCYGVIQHMIKIFFPFLFVCHQLIYLSLFPLPYSLSVPLQLCIFWSHSFSLSFFVCLDYASVSPHLSFIHYLIIFSTFPSSAFSIVDMHKSY